MMSQWKRDRWKSFWGGVIGALAGIGFVVLCGWIIGCATLPRCVIDTMTPPCTDEDGLVHKRMVENAERINAESRERLRGMVWSGLLMVDMDADFLKRKVIMVHDFDSRTDSWPPQDLAMVDSGKNKKGRWRKFAVPQDKTVIPVTYVTLWDGKWQKEKGAVTGTLDLEVNGEHCVLEQRTYELQADLHGMRVCAGGICGRIFRVEVAGEPLDMQPHDTCLKMFGRARRR